VCELLCNCRWLRPPRDALYHDLLEQQGRELVFMRNCCVYATMYAQQFKHRSTNAAFQAVQFDFSK
jgi:hypothetical protein